MNCFEDMEVISSYSRAEAIEDGVLVDVTEWASHDKGFLGGFKVPVAITSKLYGMIEDIPQEHKGIQDVRGRTHDVLYLASIALKNATSKGDNSAEFKISLSYGCLLSHVDILFAVIDGGDNGEPVVTIGFSEDF